MVRLLVASVCLTLLIVSTFADKEYVDHSHDHGHHHHHDHDGHDHHDHESHKKLFAGDDVGGTEDEQREKLRSIAKKIDVDQNGQISREELRTYVEQRIKDQHNRESDDLISSLDPKNTNKISFDAYIKDTYGDQVDILEKMDKSDPRVRETRRTYLADKQKWTQLDKDNDKTLTYEEFRRFLRPEDDENLRRIEIESIIKEYDDNNDGKISAAEYLKMTEAETGQADTLGEELDTNKDGFGDYEEFARYYLPTSSTATDEETEHLLKECDTDKNGYCTPDEIVKAYSSFAGSQITDFGADLEAAKEEL